MGNNSSHPTTTTPVSIEDIVNQKVIASYLEENDNLIDDYGFSDKHSEELQNEEDLETLLKETHPYSQKETNLYGVFVNESMVGVTVSPEQSNEVGNIVADQLFKYVRRFSNYNMAYDAQEECWIISYRQNGFLFSENYNFVVYFKPLNAFVSDDEKLNRMFLSILK